MTMREQVLEMRRRYEAFNRWEEDQPPIPREPASLVADAGALWRLTPADVRMIDPDPDKLGVQALRTALARLSSPQ